MEPQQVLAAREHFHKQWDVVVDITMGTNDCDNRCEIAGLCGTLITLWGWQSSEIERNLKRMGCTEWAVYIYGAMIGLRKVSLSLERYAELLTGSYVVHLASVL